MLKTAVMLVLAASLGAPASLRFQPRKRLGCSCTSPAPAMCREATTLDELIKALDEAVSGPADKDRSCMSELLLPEARLSPIAKRPDGTFAPHSLTLDGWTEAVRKRGHDVLNEHQVKVKVETMATLRTFGAPTSCASNLTALQQCAASTAFRRSLTASAGGARILWQAETPDLPIPEKYLP